jgi:hypothetical protein
MEVNRIATLVFSVLFSVAASPDPSSRNGGAVAPSSQPSFFASFDGVTSSLCRRKMFFLENQTINMFGAPLSVSFHWNLMQQPENAGAVILALK